MTNVIRLDWAALRRMGMIATSPSWRRHWLAWRHRVYGWATK